MANKPTQTIPNLENATPGFLVDEIGKIRVEAARLKFLEGVYKQALEARVSSTQKNGDAIIEGDSYVASYRNQTQERIDSESVKEYFKEDPEGLKKVVKIITFDVLSTKAKVSTNV